MRTCDEVHEDAVKTPRKKKWVKRAHERKRGERKKRKEKMEKGEKRKKVLLCLFRCFRRL